MITKRILGLLTFLIVGCTSNGRSQPPIVEQVPSVEQTVDDLQRKRETAALIEEMKKISPATMATAKAPAATPTVSESMNKNMWVKAFHLHIRSKPSYHSKSVGFLHHGNNVTITEVVNKNWAKMSEGRWVRLQWLEEQVVVQKTGY